MSRSLVVALLLAFGTVSGCYNPNITDGGLACGPGNACPHDFHCSNGRCYRAVDAGRDTGTVVCTSPPPAALCSRDPSGHPCNATCNSGCTCGWCGIDSNGSIACLTGSPGMKGVGEICDASRTSDCALGLRCRAEACGIARCYKFCDSNADCPTAGTTCSVNAGTLCSLSDPGCDAVNGTGCPAGLACYSDGSNTQCVCPGTAAAGAPCLGGQDCIPGYACVATGPANQKMNTCKKLCNTQLDCGLTGVCMTFGSYGYCL
jgi:hypothetical protein